MPMALCGERHEVDVQQYNKTCSVHVDHESMEAMLCSRVRKGSALSLDPKRICSVVFQKGLPWLKKYKMRVLWKK